LEFAQDAGDFAGFSGGSPLFGEAGADPIRQEADAHVVEDALRLSVEDGAHFQVALEFAKGLLDFEKVFVVALDAGRIGLSGGQAGVEKIPSVMGALGGNGLGFALPAQDAGLIDAVGKVFVGFEALEGAADLAGDFLRIWVSAFGGREFGQFGFGFGDAHLAALPVALFAPGASGNDVALALVFDFHEPVGVAQFELLHVGQFFEQGFERGVGEPGHKVQAVALDDFEVDLAAHSSVENKNGLADAEAALEDFQEALEGGGVCAVASQDRKMERGSGGVGGHGQDDLGPVAAVVPAVPIAGDVVGPRPFEVNACEVIEHQTHGFLEGSCGKAFFQRAPVAGDGVHGRVEIVLVKAFLGGEPAGRGKESAAGLVLEGEFGAGKKQAGENHRFDEGVIAGCANVGEELVESHRAPCLHENGQTAAIQGVFESDGFGLDEGATGEGLGDEFTHVVRQLGDVANGAGSGPVWGAKGLANQVGDVGFAVSAGFGGLNKHLLL